MTFPLLALLALGGAAAGPDPAALVEALGSASPEARAEAEGALEELGPRALPALLRACRSAPNAERRRSPWSPTAGRRCRRRTPGRSGSTWSTSAATATPCRPGRRTGRK